MRYHAIWVDMKNIGDPIFSKKHFIAVNFLQAHATDALNNLSLLSIFIFILNTYWRVYASTNYSEWYIIPGRKTVRDRYYAEATIRKQWSFALWCITFMVCGLWTEMYIKIARYLITHINRCGIHYYTLQLIIKEWTTNYVSVSPEIAWSHHKITKQIKINIKYQEKHYMILISRKGTILLRKEKRKNLQKKKRNFSILLNVGYIPF